MVANIETSASISGVLNYNEKKVQRGKAELIHTGNFLEEKSQMNFNEKFERFQRLNELNGRSKVNMLHVSVNFHPGDWLTKQQMTVIGDKYMEAIGLKEQPYLVYQHHDAAHPHFHIVSSLIQSDGKRIRTQNMGRNQSFKACQAIEKEFNLVKAKDQKMKQEYEPKSLDVKKIIYGKSETKKAIQNVLNLVLKQYKFTSLAELNAVLGLYNMMADRGGPNSRVYKNKGLLYRILDENGRIIGIPIKASDFYFKPTFPNLEKRFELNNELRNQFLAGIKTRIDWTLLGEPESMKQFKEDLQKEDIELVIRQNGQGIIYGLTYVDFKTKTVLNGSDLGKAYSAKGLQSRFIPFVPNTSENQNAAKRINSVLEKPEIKKEVGTNEFKIPDQKGSFIEIKIPDLLDDLMKTEKLYDELPYELKKRRKRRR